MGDVVLNEDDVVSKRDFPDGCVPSTWSIDLHYPKEQYAAKFPENPFISKAVHGRGVDRTYGYPVPYRCFYSRNVDNLFMAGRCISVTHEALGTVRVMKTCGMMGEVVGKAASICSLHGCDPRGVYKEHLDELLELLKLPGKAHRSTPSAEIVIPKDSLPLASSRGPMSGKNPERMKGIVVDDEAAELKGNWTKGTGLQNYVGYSYRYSSDEGATATYKMKVTTPGRYELRLFCQKHKNRSTKTPLSITAGGKTTKLKLNQREDPIAGILEVTTLNLRSAGEVVLTIGTEGADGNVHIDAFQLLKLK